MIDLHAHSTASDGTFSPSQLINHAKENEISVLALTDHDTVNGLEEAAIASQNAGIRFIPGIELEIQWQEQGIFHLLGLNIIDYKSAMAELIQESVSQRTNRNLAIIAAMNAAGIDADMSKVSAFGTGGSLGRPHFADYLIHNGIARDRKDAFDRYLGQGKLFYSAMGGLLLEDAISAIHKAGGKAVVAHPHTLYLSWNKLFEVLKEYKKLNLDGIEVWHPGASYKDALKLESMAVELNLGVSAGSDFHGDIRPDRKIGRSLTERRKIEERFLAIIDS